MTRRATNLVQPTHATEVIWHAAMRRNYIVSMTNPKSLAFFESISATRRSDSRYMRPAFDLWYCGSAFFFVDLCCLFPAFQGRARTCHGRGIGTVGRTLALVPSSA
jgi:threonine efflux protein